MSYVTHVDSSSSGDFDSDSSISFSLLFGDNLDDSMAFQYAMINIQSHAPIKL
jgi:hypothetical protein